MSLFDRYIAVDWSAANSPRTGKDSIWIGEAGRDSVNPPTRAQAMDIVTARLREARAAGERVFIGFDFVFGYPRGAARAIAGHPGWVAMWNAITEAVTDDPDNRSNRFEVAADFNRTMELQHFWGHPPHHRYSNLRPTKPDHGYLYIAERRIAEAHVKGPQPVWKLTGIGSVGSQSLLGIPRLEQLRRDFPEAGIWPFETDFEHNLKSITIAEIYPSMFPLTGDIEPRDREQVEVAARSFANLDAGGLLAEFLAAPTAILLVGPAPDRHRRGRLDRRRRPRASAAHRAARLAQEAGLSARSRRHLRPQLRHHPRRSRPLRLRRRHEGRRHPHDSRLRHGRYRYRHPRLPRRRRSPPRRAPRQGAHPLRLRSGPCRHHRQISRQQRASRHPQRSRNPRPRKAARHHPLGRSGRTLARQTRRRYRHHRQRPDCAVPPARAHRCRRPKPAAIIATPVGFVGATESKAELALDGRGIPFITLLGRRGGSAIAAAALNAIAKGVSE